MRKENCLGMDLPEESLRDIYYNNYDKFVRRTDRSINVDMLLQYADNALCARTAMTNTARFPLR